MIKKYLYNYKEYSSEYQVRRAVWENERKVFGKEPDEDREAFWLNLNVVYKEEADPEVPEAVLAARVRGERDRLLAESDFYVMPDYPVTEEGAH